MKLYANKCMQKLNLILKGVKYQVFQEKKIVFKKQYLTKNPFQSYEDDFKKCQDHETNPKKLTTTKKVKLNNAIRTCNQKVPKINCLFGKKPMI